MFSFWSHYGYVRPAGKFKDRNNSIVLNINEITWLRYCIIQWSYLDNIYLGITIQRLIFGINYYNSKSIHLSWMELNILNVNDVFDFQ